MESYLQKRHQLIREDRGRRVDAIHGKKLSDAEQRADRIVRDIRAAEAISVWGPESQAASGAENALLHVFPGMEFLTARETILGTQLFKILSKMPKGALLHAHLDATVNARVLLRLALGQPALHVRTHEHLTANSINDTLPQFQALPEAQFSALTSLTDDAYIPDSWVPLQKARENFHESLGGPEGFDNWVVGALMINPSQAYGTHNTTYKIWKKFASTFIVSNPLIRFAPVWTQYVREFFMSSIEDGISYSEARIMFWSECMFGADGQENIPHREWFVMYNRVLNEVKDEMKRQGREDEFVGSKIIYTTMRNITCEELEWCLEDCLSLKQEFPHLLAGFDLVGHEDSLRPLIDYIVPLKKFVERQKELGIDIPFIFHAGETLGDGTAADMNLYDAILLDTKRIGHGFSLVKHPRLMEICREKKIAVEVCPISNEILRLTSSMPTHPLPVLMNQGVTVALCSDDPAVFGNMGLSFDFFQVLVASEVTGLTTLGEMARDSLRYSCLDTQERELALSLFEKRWATFIDWVVREESKGNAAN
ncbi:Adenosine deaminase CECR1-A [Grifola frondosa]|uniref:adenosine deaminase n=1 Tax=Grifola frondosa TaxID=5627 RepID=A0A1C7LWT7_GRIFR|nr:Adenosine deaminase CECR1-A [Grifola frondosa]